MTQEMSWGLWIAIAASLIGAGTFLDRYHVSEEQRNRLREFLIQCFIFVEKPIIPDFSKVVFRIFKKLWRSWRYFGFILFLVILYWAIVSTFYIFRIWLELPPENGYWRYVINWISLDESPLFWGSVLLWGVGLGFISVYTVSILLNRINRYDSVLPQIGWAVLANLVAYLYVIVGFFCSFILFSGGPDAVVPVSGPMMGFTTPFTLFLTYVTVFPAILWVGLIGNLIFLRLLLQISQYILLKVFDVASDPKHSPFTYACSFGGVLILFVKVVAELSK